MPQLVPTPMICDQTTRPLRTTMCADNYTFTCPTHTRLDTGWTEKLRKSWKKKKNNTFDIEKKNLRLFKRIFEYTILTSILLITNTCTNIPILRGKFVAFRKEISLSILEYGILIDPNFENLINRSILRTSTQSSFDSIECTPYTPCIKRGISLSVQRGQRGRGVEARRKA